MLAARNVRPPFRMEEIVCFRTGLEHPGSRPASLFQFTKWDATAQRPCDLSLLHLNFEFDGTGHKVVASLGSIPRNPASQFWLNFSTSHQLLLSLPKRWSCPRQHGEIYKPRRFEPIRLSPRAQLFVAARTEDQGLS